MIILAVDPGNEQSAYALFDTANPSKPLLGFGKHDNDVVREVVQNAASYDVLAVEMIASYGMPVGKEVFETCVFIGRLVEIADTCVEYALVYRREVKLHLCASARAKDGNVRQALIDKYGGKERAVGKKATPGPLYGVSKDVWSALAIAVTFAETRAFVPVPLTRRVA